MASGSTRRSFEKSADEVWALLGDFGAAARWYPGVLSCVVDGDERTITTEHGVVRERLISRDGLGRRFTYCIVESAVIERLYGTVEVRSEPTGCLVEWTYDVEPDELGSRLESLYSNALDGLDAALV